ncbi:hypothetical protein [Pelodictyon luteolum]|uniref:Uncharacterized protein n=1 Tax=Chlorobium luteolum (strain DSM 273 / BCRC 81028 / 2530) TaxID=319225 RepID=Q3B4P5_CHLL3|nr:hypothetical protein [Pelodictyon luteolum]ABB23686.1 hypothetical protein Plut_0817 [Pelodictyon luteolum DSM 273]
MKENSTGGWVKLHRQMAQWEWYTDANTFRVFMHLLILVNHSDTTWRGIPVLRGQVLTGLNRLSQDLKLSVQQIRTAIARLVSTGEITNSSTCRYRVITICNYESYQKREEHVRQTLQQTGALTANNPSTASKNVKKEKNEEPLTGESRQNPEPGVLNPGFTAAFMTEVWAFYARQKTRTYTSHMLQNIAIRQLYDMAGGDEERAKDALRQTLANGYQGFTWYFNQNKKRGGTDGSYQRDAAYRSAGPTKADHASLMQLLRDHSAGLG